MLEFDRNGPYMQAGYWGIHNTPEDDCAFIRLPKPTPGTIQAIRQMWAEREPVSLATSSMKDFLKLPSRELVRRLRDGEAFIGADYPLGTIVQFEEESLSLGFKAKRARFVSDPRFDRRNYWGVVAQMDYPVSNRTVLMIISDGFVNLEEGRIEGTKFRRHELTLEVGKVVHIRKAEDKDWTFTESFRRVLSVNIWAIGKGERKPVNRRPVKDFLGKLDPRAG